VGQARPILVGQCAAMAFAVYRRFAIHWAWPRWPALREILRLGIPMSLSYALEATSFTAITLLAAR
jgi:MATE family multidrug resistance protein